MKGYKLYYQDLEAYKSSMDLVVEVYQITRVFPCEEQFGLIPQIRRAVVSIPSNIAEGCARHSDKESFRFINIALGSLAELETQVILSQRLGYIKNVDEILDKIKRINALVTGLRKYYCS